MKRRGFLASLIAGPVGLLGAKALPKPTKPITPDWQSLGGDIPCPATLGDVCASGDYQVTFSYWSQSEKSWKPVGNVVSVDLKWDRLTSDTLPLSDV
jgi:hypothetical protein